MNVFPYIPSYYIPYYLHISLLFNTFFKHKKVATPFALSYPYTPPLISLFPVTQA